MHRWHWLAVSGSIFFGIACGGSDRHTETPADTQGTTPAMGASGGSSNTDSSAEPIGPGSPGSDRNEVSPSGTPGPSPGTSMNENRPDGNNLAAIYDARASLGAPVEPTGAGGYHGTGGRSGSGGSAGGMR
jgi:hypothetical protein